MAPIQSVRPTVVSTPKPPPPAIKAAAPAGVVTEGKSTKVKTYVNTKNPMVPKDGYLQFDYKKQGYMQMPTSITLEGGKKATAKEISLDGQLAYLVTSGKEQVIAVPLGKGSGGAMRFFQPTSSQQSRQDIFAQGKQWTPVFDYPALGKVFEMAHQFANRGDPAVTSPADLAAAQKVRDRAAASGVAREVGNLGKALDGTRGAVTESTQKMAKALAEITPGLKSGLITQGLNAEGEITLSVARTPGMKDDEWARLSKRFEAPVSLLTYELRDVQAEMNRAQSLRSGAASQLVGQVLSGPFQAHLETLTPAQRLATMSEITAKVAGTTAGAKLTEELFNGRSNLSKLVVADARQDPALRGQIQGMALNMSGHLGQFPWQAMERVVEISLGRPLTQKEAAASWKLAASHDPKDLENNLANAGKKGFEQWGDVSDLLSTLGDIPDKGWVDGAPRTAGGTAFKTGALFVGIFQMVRSASDLSNEASVENIASVAEDTTRTIGAWGALLAKEGGTFSKVAKGMGVASDVIGLVKDIGTLVNAKSPEKQNEAMGNSLASAMILVGGLAASAHPVGIAIQLVGLAMKFSGDETSDAYDNAYGGLKDLTNPSMGRYEKKFKEEMAAKKRNGGG